ncbi:MAG: SDR family NAD(P)-dependent oxidoreductase [Deltaproteobacteria bacterium]
MAELNYALITGASSGIGECFARALAARKHNLVLVARSKDKLEALAEELSAKHRLRAAAFAADLSRPGAASALAERLAAKKLPVDLLVNNAGFGARGEFWHLSLERMQEMMQLNVLTLVELTHRLIPAMIANKSGAVINVSSTASFQPVPYTTIYGATKAFVTSFSMALAEELRPHGIRVVTLCPGGTRTNFFVASDYKKRTLPGGLQAPEEVVEEALRALDRSGGLVIPRFTNKMSIFSQRLVPRRTVARIAARLFGP